MPAKVDGARLHVDIHKVVDNFTLDVVLDSVDQKSLAYIYHLDERQIPGTGTKKKFTVRASEARSEVGRGARLSAPVDKRCALEAKGNGARV